MTVTDQPGATPKTSVTPLRLVTFRPTASDAPRVGVVKTNLRIVDLTTAAATAALSFDPTSMLSLIAAGDEALSQVRLAVGTAVEGPVVDEVLLLAPIPVPPRNVFAVGWNYTSGGVF